MVPLISVVSLLHNRRGHILELLENLHTQDYPSVEITIVDNASDDGSAEAVEKFFPRDTLLRLATNHGVFGYNFGLQRARGKYIVIIDDDGLPTSSQWFSQIVESFEANPRLGALGCRVIMRDTGQVAVDSPQFHPDEEFRGGFASPAYNGTGAALRSEALHQVGFYPNRYFMSWLELHLCTRLMDAGWEVRCFPSIDVWHSRPTGAMNRSWTYYGLRNYLWYVWTFYPAAELIVETLRYLASRSRRVAQGDIPSRQVARALIDATRGWLPMANTRHPVSSKTINYLHMLRRCSRGPEAGDNVHGLPVRTTAQEIAPSR